MCNFALNSNNNDASHGGLTGETNIFLHKKKVTRSPGMGRKSEILVFVNSISGNLVASKPYMKPGTKEFLAETQLPVSVCVRDILLWFVVTFFIEIQE